VSFLSIVIFWLHIGGAIVAKIRNFRLKKQYFKIMNSLHHEKAALSTIKALG